MDYEFVYSGDFLVIKLSGAARVNERLLVRESLTPHLRQSCRKVIVDLEGLDEAEWRTGCFDELLSPSSIRRCTLNRKISQRGGEKKFNQNVKNL